MAPKKKEKSDLDPEVLMRIKFLRKCRFRAITRLVMANTYWMSDTAEQYVGVEDVKRRVAQAVRGKTKKKQLLSITDKVLLNKPAENRTENERKYLYRIIGGLKCFKRYPNHVKRKLAAATYFKYYGPGRVIVRQHHEAHALYFLLTGDITVSQMIFDELLQQYVSVDIGVIRAGNMFGEVSLLHNIPRTATCTTIGHCELLQLMKKDFKNILQDSVQKQWDEVRHAMSAFSYFDGLDEVAQREGCIVAKMKSYAVNDIILGDGVGVPNFIYFVLSGRCQMIESLNVFTTHRLGRTHYRLYDPYVPNEECDQDLDSKYFAGYNHNTSGVSDVNKSSTREKKTSVDTRDSIIATSSNKSKSGILKTLKSESLGGSEMVQMQSEEGGVSQNEPLETKAESLLVLPHHQHRDSVRFSIESGPPNLRTYFIQVCQFNPGSTFGFGENMRDRRIVALTPVDCMMMPKIWLLQRNTANIWTRIQHYLEKKIPNKKQLFKEFVSERRWYEFRDEMVNDVVARSNTVNWTSVHDVPYSIRLEEIADI